MKITVDWDNQEICIKENHRRARPRMTISVTIGGITFSGSNLMFLLPDNQTATASVKPVDVKGFDAPVEALAYSSSDELIVTVDQSGLITPVGLGTAQINVTADAMIGDGVQMIAGTLDVTVIASQAVSLAVAATLS